VKLKGKAVSINVHLSYHYYN